MAEPWVRVDSRDVIPIFHNTENTNKSMRGTTEMVMDEILHPHLSGEEGKS